MDDTEAGGGTPSALPPVAEDADRHFSEEDEISDLDDDDEGPGDAVGNDNGEVDDFSDAEEEQRETAAAAPSPQDTRPSLTGARDPKDRMDPRRSRRSTSLMLRKVPSHILLSDKTVMLEDLDLEWSSGRHLDGGDNGTVKEKPSSLMGWLLRPCLNPRHSLRRQMMTSFGTVSAVTILFVMLTAIIASVASGNSIKSQSRTSVEGWIKDSLGTSARYVAETLSPRIMPNDLVQIMYEATRDRFAGYPTTEDDSLVPFRDTTTGTNVYPLQGPTVPLDWQFVPEQGNVNAENYREHVQDRWSWYNMNPRLSTATSFYTMQGACDPRTTDPNSMTYYPNCTDANNDLSTGGVVAPTQTNQQVARKSADLSFLLKALYEKHQDVKELGIFFANGGAGSSLMYPHFEVNGLGSYTSVGCEWMKQPNPIDPTRPIGTEEEIDRCHPEGEVVAARDYNPLERGWCRDQALNPDKILNGGPYVDAWNNDIWLMIHGRAVYDRVTNEFVTCIGVDNTLDNINKIIEDVQINDWSTLTLVRWDGDGTVIVSPNFDYDTASDTTTVGDESLGSGVDAKMFQEMKSLVDFDEPWDPEEVSDLYETTFFENDGKVIVAYPMPILPDAYDPDYSPQFMAILSVDKQEGIIRAGNALAAAVDEQARNLIMFTLIIGCVGLAIVLVLIYVVASHLTEPLLWMNKVADQIVGKFGEELDTGIDYERKKERFHFSPKTELDDLVKQFQKMVSKFSGEGTAKSAKKIKPREVRNRFALFDEFRDLYQSRKEPDFEFDYATSSPHLDQSDGQDDVMPERLHVGPNVRGRDGETTCAKSLYPEGNSSIFASPLFWWIVALIVTPLLATTVSISAVVLWNIGTELPSLIVPVREQFVDLRTRTRYTAATIRAVQASGITDRAARDTHVVTRLASWLLFGGLQMSGSTTEMLSGSEECKTAPARGACDFYKDKICDCDWHDRSTETCSDYVGDSRYLQRVSFSGESHDVWPNGDRNYTTFPDVDSSPETTAWWDDVDEVPGSDKGPLASAGYETTYDRLKVLSALSSVFVPLYNYDNSKDKPLAVYVGFEADGLYGGYLGCDQLVGSPFWMSSADNGAAKMRPELCPLFKYGYDPRCRGWYDTGRKMAMEDAGPLYITPPYLFVEGAFTGQSASSPLIDPKTQKHVGQTLVDFLPNSIFTSLQEKTQLAKGGFPLLITPEFDSMGYDTVIGPGYSLDGPGKSIDELLLPYDKRNCYEDDCSNWQGFEKIRNEMRAGETGAGSFFRTGADGVAEKVLISYAPVAVKSYRPLDSSDFSSGVEEYDTLVYSLALAETETGMLEPLQAVEDTINKQVKICIGVLTALIVFATAFVIFFSRRVTQSLIEPIMRLLDLIRKINRLEITEDDVAEINDFSGSSREVTSVYNTMEMLFRVVRFANSSFFSGDLDEAYIVLKDALRLFTRLGNAKAIAVASNNLGNVLLAMYRTMKSTKELQICGMTEKEIISKGIAYFGRAIKLGETAYDQFYEEEGWSKRCLGFMQHLANRYFNRSVFLLTIKDDHEKPDEAKSLGFRDLQIVQDMDIEVVDQCVEVGFTVDKAERYDLVMSRLRGLVGLLKLGYTPEDLAIEEQIEEAVKELKAAAANPSSEIFENMEPAGRMQQLDVELLRYAKLTKRGASEVARIGVRMLVEDDYTFPEAQYKAIDALVAYIDAQGKEGSGAKYDSGTRGALRNYQASLETDAETVAEAAAENRESLSSTFMSSLSDDAKIRALSTRSLTGRKSTISNQRRSVSLKESTRGDVTMETF